MRRRRRHAWLAPAVAFLLTACTTAPTISPSSSPLASSATEGSGQPPVQPTAQVSQDAIRAHLEALQGIAEANGGVRTAGTAGYEVSVQYVAGQLRDLGYTVETPEFQMATFAELPGASIEVEGGARFEGGPDFHAMIYSASGEVSASVAPVGYDGAATGGCNAADFNDFPRGAIAVAPPGPCFRREVVLNAVRAGAVAVVVAYPQRSAGQNLRPTLVTPDGVTIPALSASGEVGVALRAAADAGTQVRVSVQTEVGEAMVHNVIADSAGGGDRVVMLGGHLDSVHDGPGINDNGSGVAALLEIARVLTTAHPVERVRLAFWGGEEFGLLGSAAYVKALDSAGRGAIAAYLNFDMIGSPNYVPFVYDPPDAASGSTAIADFLASYLDRAGVGSERLDVGAASDHFPFQDAGIPVGGIFSGANEVKTADQATRFGGTANAPMDACYHLPCDTVDNVDLGHVALFAAAALAVTSAIARGDLSIP